MCTSTGDGEQTICKIPNEKTVSLMGWHVPRLRRETLAMFLRWVRFSSGPRWSTRWLRVKMMNNVPVITNGIVWNSNNVRVTKRDLIRKETYRRIGRESPRLNLLTLWRVKWFWAHSIIWSMRASDVTQDYRFKSGCVHKREKRKVIITAAVSSVG